MPQGVPPQSATSPRAARWPARWTAITLLAQLRGGWPIVWGALLAAPRLVHPDAFARLAAIAALLWLFESASEQRRGDGASIGGPAEAGPHRSPNQAIRHAAAGLSIAALLGLWPLLVAVTAIAVDGAFGRAPSPRGLQRRGAMRSMATAAGTWLALGGWAITASGGPSAVGWGGRRALFGAAAFLIFAGAALLVAAVDDRPTQPFAPPAPIVWLGAGLLAAGLVLGQRPAGLWVAGLVAAAAWPLWPLRPARTAVRTRIAIGLPALMAGVCAVDGLLR
ncbi:MAG: hypothetical protein ABI780_01310 [Ardenticatenales bacterium]